MTPSDNLPDIRMDSDALYREETYTDRRAGVLRVLVPVTADGQNDASRETIFEGQAHLMTSGGALPLNFEIPAANLSAALDAYPEAAQKALKDTLEEFERLRREQSLLMPGASAGMGAGPGGGIVTGPMVGGGPRR